MIVTRLIPGFVIQKFDTDSFCFISQEFIRDGFEEIEDENGELIELVLPIQEVRLIQPGEKILPQGLTKL